MSGHDERLAHPVAPHQRGGQMDRIQGTERSGKWVGCASQYGSLEQDEIDLEAYHARRDEETVSLEDVLAGIGNN